MNFSDMLKNTKKNTVDDQSNVEQGAQPAIEKELETVNTSRLHDPSSKEEAEAHNVADSPDADALAEKARAELTEANEKYLRLYAEFDNYKRRTTRERIDLLQTAGKDVIVSLLPVLDDFERAINAMEATSDRAPVQEGVVIIYNKFKNILSQQGLKAMESKGQAFDFDIHEAVTSIPAPSDDLKGKVIDEVEKGYYLNEKVIRHAKVIVGN